MSNQTIFNDVIAFYPEYGFYMLRENNVHTEVPVGDLFTRTAGEHKWITDRTGNIINVPVGTLPLSDIGMWSEKTATACHAWPRDLTNAVWSKEGVELNTGPPGFFGGNATVYSEQNNGGHWIHQDSLVTYSGSTQRFAGQVWLKKVSLTMTRYVRLGWDFNNKIDLSGQIRFNLNTGIADDRGADVDDAIGVQLINDWWLVRVYLTKVLAGNAPLKFYMKALNDDGSDSNGPANSSNQFLFDGHQCENTAEATTFMDTPASAPVRAIADDIRMSARAMAVFNPEVVGHMMVQTIPETFSSSQFSAPLSFGRDDGGYVAGNNRHDLYWLPSRIPAQYVKVGGVVRVDQYQDDSSLYRDDLEHRHVMNVGLAQPPENYNNTYCINGHLIYNVGCSAYWDQFTAFRLGGAHHDAGGGMNFNGVIEAFKYTVGQLDVAALTNDSIVTHDAPSLPAPALVTTWSQVSGPGTATFTNVFNPTTDVTFNLPGIYVLRLEGNDGTYQVTDDVTITMLPDGWSGGSSIIRRRRRQ